ncbi:MAG: hypothetical protein ABI047_12260 [Jatrophihabitantaceae bacterium]
MSDIERTENADAACCANAGCGTRFDPAREGFNGECDLCASVAADHFVGAHRGLQTECGFCWAEEPAEAQQPLALAA